MSEEKKLNKQQLAAVTHKTGPLLVIAGAGTGKTTVITRRVKWLIDQKLARPEEILCLTFTEKAAAQMEERLDLLLPLGYTQMWISTFHSFCDRLLRDAALHIGLPPDFRLLTATDSVAFFRKHLFDFPLDYFRPLGNPFKFIDSLLFHFSRLKDEDISADQYLDWAKNQRDQNQSFSDSDRLDSTQYLELARLYADYEQTKVKEGVLDFSDLVSYTLILFRARPNILKKYRQKFKYVLVDEYQDTNYAQNRLVDLLVGDEQNLTVVADDDQAIYRWRGAAVSNVIQFRQIYPGSALIVLTQNYRSTTSILDAAYRLIQHNNPDRLEAKEGITKKLTSVRHLPGTPIEFSLFDRVESEADFVAKKIKELLQLTAHHLQPKDFAILVRANAHAQPFVRALDRHGIPNQFLGPGRLFQQPEIKDLIAYLKLLHDLHDDAAFYRVLSMDIFQVSPKDLALLSLHARKHHLSLFAAAESEIGTPVRHVTDFANRHLPLVAKHTVGDILYQFLVDSGLMARLLQPGTSASEATAANISKFFTQLKSLEIHPAEASLAAAVDWLDLSDQIGESPLAAQIDFTENNTVNLLTVHSAKGLEFPIVFLVNLTVGRFPSLHRRDLLPLPDILVKEILPQGDFHTQEERRLFYVGLTRAKDHLFLTASKYYGEGKRLQKTSPFIAEALGSGFQISTPTLEPSFFEKPLDASSPPPTVNLQPITVISYSQIETFKDCPLHYRAKYILHIPSPPSAASSFGNTIHAVLKDYYDTSQGEKADVLSLLDAHWTPVGYQNKRHEQQYLARGRKFLQALANLPPDFSRTIVSLELPFRVPVDPSRPLQITGKIDRIDKLADGRIEIIDYKTSAKPLTPKQAQTDLQLSFYALAAILLPYPPFGLPADQILLTLFYLDDQTRVSTTRTPDQLKAAKAEIFSWVDQIAASRFRCSRSEVCRICDYRILCDLASDVPS